MDLPEFTEEGAPIVGLALKVLQEEDTLALRLKLDVLVKNDPDYADLLFKRSGDELWLLRRSRCNLPPRRSANAKE